MQYVSHQGTTQESDYVLSRVLPAFVRALGFEKPLRPGFWPFPPIKEAPEWWITQEVANAVGGAVLIPGLTRELYVDQSRQDVYTLYLRTFEV